ncbi:hypothetical protein S1OALGB6SA_1722 [Olavius algarvensis spirochete endosymbiont]|uniref:enoyl-CoA hydratase/isomerase family protein n=1 Tax=Olavius algarvensis spirochete endosymbiont TaxID=260710 RepID=UPI00052C01D3|nr:enoyl-CoA hydratase/isomerase family protein [Olavius algarvensis spirochete endosymbiont]KGM44190.1 hypothetical protein JY97_02270 [Alkalispirochaeta odontotermitis]CAD7841872.1 MAG: hypothetical protein [Olavius algarvensis spirochete endosymbiont]VDB00639.1 hypothetical protein S1OALGB6SA_1722 [Olavius algarvensis spirochete endosymbiont]
MELAPAALETFIVSGAGIIVMGDGDGGNRLTPGLIDSLMDAVEAHVDNPDVRFIILRSRGAHFCHGMDLEAYLANPDREALEREITSYAALLLALNNCPKTTLAVLEGSVKAGGVGLASACDIVIASEEVVFELSEAYWGLIPANVIPYLLTCRISPKRAAYLIQTAAAVKANDALILGLVEEVHPKIEMERAVRRIGRRLSRISPLATSQYKAFVADIQDLPLAERGKIAVGKLVQIASNSQIRNSIHNFLQGDAPVWFKSFKPTRALTESGEEEKV